MSLYFKCAKLLKKHKKNCVIFKVDVYALRVFAFELPTPKTQY